MRPSNQASVVRATLYPQSSAPPPADLSIALADRLLAPRLILRANLEMSFLKLPMPPTFKHKATCWQ